MRVLRIVKTLYMRELLHLGRDRHTLIYSIAIPIFLYPTILFCVFQSMAVVRGWRDAEASRIYFAEAEDHPLLVFLLEKEAAVELVTSEKGFSGADNSGLENRIRGADLDAVLRVQGDLEAGESLHAEVLFSSARGNSTVAEERLGEILKAYRDKILLKMSQSVGADTSLLDVVDVHAIDIASGEKKANYILSLTMPLLMIVILLMGAFYPALDAAAGERERLTLETTLVAPVPRFALVVGKYLAVVTLALLAFVLNFLSMTFSFKHVIAQMNVQAFIISPSSILVIACGAILLAALLSALMMAVAFMARSFKEGQSYMAPIYLLALGPVLVTLSPNVRFTPFLATVPVVNVTLVFREVLQSRFEWTLIVWTLLSSSLWAVLAISVAAWLVSRESYLLGEGSASQSLFARLRRRQ